MKRPPLYLVIVIALLTEIQFSSCKKDKTNKTIIGTWSETTFTAKYFFDGKLIQDTTIIINPNDHIMTLLIDSTYVEKREEVEWGGTFKTISDTLVFTVTTGVKPYDEISTYKFSGDDLTIIYRGDESLGTTSKYEYTYNYRRK